MKSIHAGLLALALLLAAPMAALAGEGGHEGKGKHKEGMMKALNLTDEQKEKFKAIQDERKAVAKEFKEKVKDVREKLQKEVDAATPNDAAIKSLLDELESAMNTRQQKMEAIKQKTKALLTPVQQAKIALKFGKNGNWKKRSHDDE